jgi:glycosyltransferase involved in cell wall biosynthesis
MRRTGAGQKGICVLQAQTIDTSRASTTVKRLRVTMLGSLPPTKGVSPYTAELVDALSARPDIDLEVLAFKSIYPAWLYPGGDPEERGTERRFANARVRRFITWYNPLTWAWAGLTLRGDVVHAQWWSYVLAPVYATVLGIARLRGKKVVVTVHNVAPHEHSRLKRFMNDAVLRFADRLVVHSEANRARIDPAVVPKVSVVPMGIHPAKRTGIGQKEARERLGLPIDVNVILNFGNIRPYKGIDVLVRAFAGVLEQRPQALLLIAGKPWSSWEPYQRLIDSLGIDANVRTYLDYVPSDDIELYFEAADVVALPYTHFDAQSAVGALALPFGKPLVVSDVGGLPELVGTPTAVVPAGDDEALSAALILALRDSRLRQRRDAESLKPPYEVRWEPIAEATRQIYRDISGSYCEACS